MKTAGSAVNIPEDGEDDDGVTGARHEEILLHGVVQMMGG